MSDLSTRFSRPLRRVSGLPPVLLAALLVTACASSPQPDAGPVSYRLDLCSPAASAPATASAPASAAGEPPITVQLMPIQLAGALDQTGVAVQTGPVQIGIARRHLWASPLPEQLTDTLAQGLQSQLDALGRPGRVVSSSGLLPGSGPAPWRLALEVNHFEGQNSGSSAGQARVSGRWTLLDGRGVRASAPFEQRLALSQAGYPALIQALSCAWQRQAGVIAGALR